MLFDYDGEIRIISIQEVKKEMNAPIEPQIVHRNGVPAFAVIPWDEYQGLISAQMESEGENTKETDFQGVLMVGAAGIEPASGDIQPRLLHAYPEL